MLSNGVDSLYEVRRINSVEEPGTDQSRHTATWKGFLVSECRNSTSKLALTGIIFIGGVCMGVGIQQRSLAASIAIPILTLIAEAAYFGRKAYDYFKVGICLAEEINTRDGGGDDDRLRLEGLNYIDEEMPFILEDSKTFIPDDDLTDIDFLKAFETNYFYSSNKGFDLQVKLFESLKNRFSNYFSRHDTIKSQFLLEDKDQCGIVFEGIFNCYRLGMNKTKEYRVLVTIDNGDCLYDALWKGLSSDMQEFLSQKYQQQALELEDLAESENFPYLTLKALLLGKATDEKYGEIILKNGHQFEVTPYDSIDAYKCLIKDRGKFWGRHNIEGKILAEELDHNLILIAGCDYNQQGGFTCWEDEQIYVSITAERTLYIEFSHQHYSAAQKQAI